MRELIYLRLSLPSLCVGVCGGGGGGAWKGEEGGRDGSQDSQQYLGVEEGAVGAASLSVAAPSSSPLLFLLDLQTALWPPLASRSSSLCPCLSECLWLHLHCCLGPVFPISCLDPACSVLVAHPLQVKCLLAPPVNWQ